MSDRRVIGWREWVSLPDLGVRWVKAKVDTGARSSSLHAFDLEIRRVRGREIVHFSIHPLQRTSAKTVRTHAEVLEYREIRSSSGQTSTRPVIVTPVSVCGESWPIELTLANRDEMGFRMLLGRQAVRGRMVVDPGASFYGARPPKTKRSKTTPKKKKTKAKAKAKAKAGRKTKRTRSS